MTMPLHRGESFSSSIPSSFVDRLIDAGYTSIHKDRNVYILKAFSNGVIKNYFFRKSTEDVVKDIFDYYKDEYPESLSKRRCIKSRRITISMPLDRLSKFGDSYIRFLCKVIDMLHSSLNGYLSFNETVSQQDAQSIALEYLSYMIVTDPSSAKLKDAEEFAKQIDIIDLDAKIPDSNPTPSFDELFSLVSNQHAGLLDVQRKTERLFGMLSHN